MAAAPAAQSHWDDLDAILADEPDASNPAPDQRQEEQNNARRSRLPADISNDLGIDEEIKVRKPRVPIAKLDEDRLLSEKGIPRLRRITKSKLKFKGKGHEFSDVARLLTTYQLWLDDLFPKANFADGLDLMEKVGHKKRMQIMRREWINEDKPKATVADEELEEDDRYEQAVPGRDNMDTDDEALFVADDSRARPVPSQSQSLPTRGSHIDSTSKTDEQSKEVADGPEEDELDALLAEDSGVFPPRHSHVPQDDDFADEMEAMGDQW